jgi:hypothetical protein
MLAGALRGGAMAVFEPAHGHAVGGCAIPVRN